LKVIQMKQLRYENGDIDTIDLRILSALADNARVSIADLAREIGMSAPSIAERIRRLEQAGVITGYT
jgi:Lrp/AsnC family leucine-responsive transcriptional regulator